ncbi:MAG TPA: cytochrome c oxidase assembly protein, partial [Solirubrobacteraceae bacterium]|nr:cytochrome c oxidase assembly protein [Solirubrobacteraceae bacterium]
MSAELLLLGELAAAGAVYVAGARRVHRWPAARTTAFGAGLAVLGVALIGLDAAAHRRLSAHMVQHLLLAFAAAPLLVAASPVALALRATRRTAPGRRAAPLAAALGHPLLGWAALPAVMALTHFTAVYGEALEHPLVHAGEHAAYLLAALAFWRPVLGADPVRRRPGAVGRLLYLLLAAGPLALVGVAMQSSTRPWYAAYAGRPGALADQHAAGALMWVGGGLALALLIVAVAWTAIEREH